ncbi:MAG: hypothetical protein C0601_08160 [Candidatus Muiribacterium halophilum]|uniref:Uncharacterized protein n=1 Tax=Muiribacterium halophilum TaxID=2053465 RepID=A0A2N5ZEV0_MUIH1|nr:MAG: hypothetical protein C0601_08160 [Candidatus Muirbacterium halophilum]
MKIKLSIIEIFFIAFLILIFIIEFSGFKNTLYKQFDLIIDNNLDVIMEKNPDLSEPQLDMLKKAFEELKKLIFATYYTIFLIIALPIYFLTSKKKFEDISLPSPYFLLVFVILASILLLFRDHEFIFLKNILSMMFFNYIIIGVAIFIFITSHILKNNKFKILNYILAFLLLTRLREFFFLVGIADHWVDLRKKVGGKNGSNIDKRL